MCHIYSHTDPILYECRSRSVRISKVVTSIKLENLFWDALSQLAHDEGLTTNQLIAKLYDEVYACRAEATNFASFLRVTCMRYLELRSQSMQAAKRVLTKTEQQACATKPAVGAADSAAPHGPSHLE